MSSKPVAFLLADLGVTKTHSRPHVSDDNPYSESQFRTMKYRPEFPDRFGCIQDSRAFCQDFFVGTTIDPEFEPIIRTYSDWFWPDSCRKVEGVSS
jgi:hypothetical protein